MNLISVLEHLVFAAFVAVSVRCLIERGWWGYVKLLTSLLRAVPGVDYLIMNFMKGEVGSFIRQVDASKSQAKPPMVKIPETGIAHEELMKEMDVLKGGDQNAEEGKMFAYVYTGESNNFALQRKAYNMFTESTGLSPDHDKLVSMFHNAFMHENALNPMMFPSLRKFENEVVSMTAALMNGDNDVVGSVTSGGTESILMAMKAYRDRAHKLFPHITKPNVVAPITIHPAHEKAAHYFGLEIIHVPVDNNDFIPNIREFERAITPNTIALLCSAPQYCHGIMDPIEDIAEIAVRRGLPLHVDSCFGGFMLPWVEKLGYPVPKFDFRVQGVTTITADIHKYGFGAKGASVVLYKNAELRKYQYFAYSGWPGGLFGSPTMAGTRPGGNLAASWVALKAMGQDGYTKMAKQIMETTEKLKAGINKIPGLCTLGKPCMTAFAVGSTDSDIEPLELADAMEERGWKIERNQKPNSLHCTIMPHHVPVADDLLKALEESAQQVKNNKGQAKKGGSAAVYGMVANIPDQTIVDDFIIEFFSEVYKT